MIDTRAAIRRAGGVLAQRIDDEVVLLDAELGHYFALNSTGAFLWDCIGTEVASVRRLVASLTASFDVSKDVAERDVLDLIERLLAQGLVVLEESPARESPARE